MKKVFYFAIYVIRFFSKRMHDYYALATDMGFKKRYGHMQKKQYALLFDNIRTVQFAEKLDVSFASDAGFLIANIPVFGKRVKFILDKKARFYLLKEQFLQRTSYNFIFDIPIIIIDIGMNVGDTALFFAADPYVKKIYSYELMPQVYNIAIQNFNLNSDIANKIKSHDYGLGKDTQELQISYIDDSDTYNSMLNSMHPDRGDNAVQTLCKIKNVAAEMNKIVQENPGCALYLKIDAEGAEYEIVDEIFQSELSENIRYVAMEYHLGVQNLIKILKEHHFEVAESFSHFYDGKTNHAVGNIKAVRQIIKRP